MSETTAPPAEGSIERRLATILCADVAGYSQMMGENEERTVRVFRGHREVFESLVRMHRGRIFNTAGDALLAEFMSAVEAVRCATEIQAALRTRNDQLAPEERMLFRIGINLGDVIVQGGDLLGDGVNVAARIQTATEPGGVCISGSVHDQIQNKLSLEFRLLGEQSYKNIAKPVRTYTITEGGVVTRPARKRAGRAPVLLAIGALLVLGALYAGYRAFEVQREEKARLETQLAAQLAESKAAAEKAQRAADDARREAQLLAQKSAAEESLRRSQEERARLEQERKLLESEKRAGEAAKKALPPAPAPGSPPATVAAKATRFDGTYNGQLCNHLRQEAKPQCWPVVLVVRDGVAEAGWLGRQQRNSSAKGTVGADGTLEIRLAGWTPEGQPSDGALSGRIENDVASAAGRWREGAAVVGNWKRASVERAASPPPPAKALGKHDGVFAGELCNAAVRARRENCWPVELEVRNDRASASWLSRTKKTSTASGTVAADGQLQLKLAAWTPEGNPISAVLTGRVEGDDITAAGQWSNGHAVRAKLRRAR